MSRGAPSGEGIRYMAGTGEAWAGTIVFAGTMLVATGLINVLEAFWLCC
jgi:hypothetical protein